MRVSGQKSSAPFALIEFEPQGNEAFTRRSERVRLRAGPTTMTLYTVKEDIVPAIEAGRMRARLVERVTRGGKYVDRKGPYLALLRASGVWYLTASTVEAESDSNV